MKSNETETIEYILKEQCPDSAPLEIKTRILSEGGQIWIGADGYGFGQRLGMETGREEMNTYD